MFSTSSSTDPSISVFLQSHSFKKKMLFHHYIYIIYTERQNDRCINVLEQDVHYLGNALWTSSNMKKRRDKKEWKVYFSKIL